MDFGDLVRTPAFEISVIVGARSALDRPVTGSYITDLTDPSRFLFPGVVVLTSGQWAYRPDGVATFIDAVAESQAVALIVGLIDLGHVPDTVIEACRASGVVLATISDAVSFATVAEAIWGAGAADADGRAFAARIATVCVEEGAQAAVALVAHTVGVACWVLDEAATLVAASEAPDEMRVGSIWNDALASRNDADASSHLLRADATAWRLDLGETDDSGLLVAEVADRKLGDDDRLALDALALALRGELRFAAQSRAGSADYVHALIAATVDESVPPGEISALMRMAGLDPQSATTVLVADVDDPGFPPQVLLAVLERLVSAPGLQLAACTYDGRALVVLNGGDGDAEALRSRVAGRLDAVLPLLGSRRMRVAVSDPLTGVSRFGGAYAVAVERLDDAAGEGPVTVASASTSDSHRSLLRLLGDSTRTAFALSVLRPLLEYDAKHGADLVTTIRTFLASGSSWQEGARQLHVHPNTLRYRIARIEDLTSRDLGTMEDRVDLFLALACLPD